MAERITVIITAEAEQAVRQFQQATGGITEFANQAESVGRKLSMKLTLPIMAAATASTMMARTFSSEMTKIETLVGVAGNTVTAWKKQLLEMTTEVGRSPAELAQGLFVVTSAGVRGAESLDILRMSAKAAAVGMGETADIARTITAAVQAFRVQGLTAAQAADVMTATIREGNLAADSLAGSLGRVLGPAAAVGASFADVGAFIAAFSRFGVTAPEAVTSLSAAFTLAIKPTQQAREAMEAVGYSVEQFRRTITEQGVAQALREMLDATDANLDLIGQFIPNVRALRGILATAGAQAEQYAKIQDTVRHSTEMTNEAFERTAEGSGFAMKQMYATLKTAAVSFGTMLLPAVQQVHGAMTTFARVLADMDPWLKKVVIGLGAFLAALGPLILALTTFGRLWVWTQAARAVLSMGALAAAKTTLLSLGAVLTPGGLVLVGLGALAAAFIYADRVAQDAKQSWAEALDTARNSIAGLDAASIQSQMQGALSQLNSFEKLQRELKQLEAEEAKRKPHEVSPGVYGMGGGPRNLAREARIAELTRILGEQGEVATALRAKVEMLTPAWTDMAVAQLKAAAAAIETSKGTDEAGAATVKYEESLVAAREQLRLLMREQSGVEPQSQAWNVLGRSVQRMKDEIVAAQRAVGAAQGSVQTTGVATGRTIKLSAKQLGETFDDLKKTIESTRRQLYTLEVSQGNVAAGTEVWKTIGDSIANARTEIQLTEAALREVTAELGRIKDERIGAMDFLPRMLGSKMLGLQIPNLEVALGGYTPLRMAGTKDKDGKFTATAPTLSASSQVQQMLAAQRASTEAGVYGLSPEQFNLVKKAAMGAGMATEDYAKALGLVAQASMEWESVAITGMGAVVAAFAGGMGQIEVTVVNAMTQIMQNLSQKDGPLGALFGGFGVPVFGAIGGILGAVLAKRNDRQRVEVDRYSATAMAQQKSVQPSAPDVQVILVDAQGNEIRRISSQLRRLTALDGVTRLPGYMPVGG